MTPGLVILFIFALGYNLLIGYVQKHNAGNFTALQVIIGLLVVKAVEAVELHDLTHTTETWILYDLLYLAAAGGPMTWGSWRRRKGPRA